MTYYITLSVFVISSLINVGLAVYSWRRRQFPGAYAFFVSTILFTVWPVVQAIDLTVTDLNFKVILMKTRLDAPVFGGIAWLVMVAQITGREKLVTWRRLVIISSLPALTMLLNLTEFSAAFRHSYYIDQSGAFPILRWENGFWFWVWFVWSYAIFISPFFMLAASFRNLAILTRRQIMGVLFALGLPVAVNLLFQFGVTPLAGFNFAPAVIAVSGLVIVWAVFRYHLFDVVPIARGLLIDSMTDGVLVLDTQNRIVDANPAILKMIKKSREDVIAKDTKMIFAAWPNLLERFDHLPETHAEIRLDGEPARYFELSLTPLLNTFGHISGRLVTIRDTTESKQTEMARIHAELELQNALKRTNILYEITKAAISSNSVDTLLEQTAQMVAQGLPADRVSLIVLDVDKKKIKNFARGGPHGDQIVLSVSYNELIDGLSGWAIINKKSALSPKGEADPRESPSVQKRRAETNCGCILVTPLLHQEETLGTITVINRPDEPDFNQNDIELLEAVSAQIASAMVKLSLEENMQGFNKRLSLLHETTLDLLNRRAIDDLLQSIIEQASEFLNVPYCEILLKEGDHLVVKAFTRNQEFLEGDRVTREEAHLSWQAFDTRLPAVINDYSNWPLRRDIYSDLNISAVASIPIIAHGMSIGVLDLSRDEPKPYEEPEIHAATLFTQLAALALDNAQLHENLRQEAIRDPLTGLFNRRFMEETLVRELGRAQRKSQPLTVVMLDMDNLKEINDTYGHDVGDDVISQISLLLRSKIRTGDTACRYGGDEFIIILPETAAEDAKKRMEECINNIRNIKIFHEGKPIKPVTMSVGVAEYPRNGEIGPELLKAVDNALYRAKQAGRDTVKQA